MPTTAELGPVAVVTIDVVECYKEAVVVPDVSVNPKEVPAIMQFGSVGIVAVGVVGRWLEVWLWVQ